MAEHDDKDWDDDDWDDDDDQDVEPYVPEPAPPAAPSPADPGPTAQMPAVPSYDDDPVHSDDDGMLAPPPIEEFADQPAVARSRSRRTRARAVTQAGGAEIDPVPAADLEPEPETEPSRRSGCIGVTIVVVLVVAILAVMGWALVTMGPLAGLMGDDDDVDPLQVPAPQQTTQQSSATPTSAAPVVQSARDAADEECSDSPAGTVAGNGPGSRDSGTDVILAFDHAYYVDRNGTAARGFMSEEITGTTSQSLQEAIDELPEDTAHCLKMRPKEGEEGVYLVDLIVFRNDGQELVRTEDAQTIYVEEADDKYSIIGIINE
ncbi:MAG: hypothetical protein DI630_13455 [Gordonia sp. (in: high G+C Gram-positive bacteria)]|nr:MAG: hypothetical protein DI630_13455 [Gordonia sp. (in: high G+C Gram-positive bacteria)]